MRINGFPSIEQCPKCHKPLIELAGTCCKCNPDRDRWDILKRRIEAYKQMTLTIDKNQSHNTCVYFLREMERLEKTYPVEEK